MEDKEAPAALRGRRVATVRNVVEKFLYCSAAITI